MRVSIFLFCFLLTIGCAKVEPRKPISPKPSTTILKTLIEESKVINKIEEEKIAQIIALDSTSVYHLSPFGFWYTYNNKIENDAPKPQEGNEIVFEYEILDLNNTTLYSKEELGIKNYKVDKEDFITGLQHGLKLMKEGETITFVLPSYNAFGITGDGNKVGINQSIKSRITLLKIK